MHMFCFFVHCVILVSWGLHSLQFVDEDCDQLAATVELLCEPRLQSSRKWGYDVAGIDWLHAGMPCCVAFVQNLQTVGYIPALPSLLTSPHRCYHPEQHQPAASDLWNTNKDPWSWTKLWCPDSQLRGILAVDVNRRCSTFPVSFTSPCYALYIAS